MGAPEGDGGNPIAREPRTEYLKSRILSTFPKSAGPKFDKLFDSEDNQAALASFFDGEDAQCLFCSDSIKLDTKLPERMPKGKTVAFVKAAPGPVAAEAVGQQLMAMELGGGTPFEHVELIAHEVFLPLLSNGANQVGLCSDLHLY